MSRLFDAPDPDQNASIVEMRRNRFIKKLARQRYHKEAFLKNLPTKKIVMYQYMVI